MKISQADKWFSKLIREGAFWICQRCGIISEEGRATGGDRAMQCSHFISRQYKSVRLDSNNALCLCASCHAHVEKDPSLHCDLYDSINGAGLREKPPSSTRCSMKRLGNVERMALWVLSTL